MSINQYFFSCINYNNHMRKQFLMLIIISLMLWSGVFILGNQIPPTSIINILFFIFYLLLTFGVSISLIIFLVKKRRAVTPQRIQDTFNFSLKWGFFIALGLMGTLGLNAFELINPLNFGLFILFYLAIFLQIKDKK